jgi:hypothetical protein
MREMRNTKFWSENFKGRGHLEELGVGGRIMLDWLLEKCGVKLWSGCNWLRIGTSGGLL